VDAVIASLNVAGKVFTDKTVKQRAENVLLKIPAIDRAANIIGDLPDLALQGGALLGARHYGNSVAIAYA
jgi:hypothetical protein